MSEDNQNQREEKIEKAVTNDNGVGESVAGASSSGQQSMPSGSMKNDPYEDDEILTVEDIKKINQEMEQLEEESEAVLGDCIEQCTFDFVSFVFSSFNSF